MLRTADGLDLYWQHWPAAEPADVLVNMHGLGDHGGLHPFVIDHFRQRGTSVYALDARGNGRSPGKRGHVVSWDDYRDDLDRFIQLVRAREKRAPVLLGHSLGGLMVLDYALARPEMIRGVAAAAPPLGPLNAPPHLLALAQVLTRLWPSFTLETGFNIEGLAHNPEVSRVVRADPYFHRRVSARLATEVQRVIASVHSRAATLAVPALIMHGAGDRMVPIDGSRRFASESARSRTTYIEYPDGWHALFADAGHEQRLLDLERWMKLLPLPDGTA
jgi:alpha-beta hydrolase superfamily lysophospholipase